MTFQTTLRGIYSGVMFVLLTLFTAPAFSADTVAQLATQLRAQGAFRSVLIQEKHLANFKKPLRAQGYILFVPNEAMLYVLEQPVPARYRMRSESIEVIEASAPMKKLTRNELPWLEALTSVFTGVMAGDLIGLQQHFSVHFTPGVNWTVHLTPHAGVIEKAMQGIDISGSAAIESITLLDHNGDATHLLLSQTMPLSPSDHALLTEVW